MENNQNFLKEIYKKKYKSNYHLQEDIEHTFNIIEAFYRRQDEICEGEEKNGQNKLKQTSEIQGTGKLQAPKLNPTDNIYFSTDHHGDLSAFMFSLLESGVAKFKEGGPSTIYFDMNTNEVIENEKEIKEYIEKNGINGLVPIPNLEINPEFNGKFICGGDLMDRGKETDNCFCLMHHLLNQPGAENKIEYIVGNHEEMIIKGNRYHYNGNNFELIQKSLINLTENGKLKLASPSGQTIFSHTVFNKEQILIALDVMINDEKRDKYFNNGNYDDKIKIKIDFNENIKIHAKALKEKIEENKELKEEDIELLTVVLNDLFAKKVESLKNIKPQMGNDDIFMINGNYGAGLLWQRYISEEDKINGLYQVVGHEPQIYAKKPKLENKIIRADAYQSSGYNNNYSNAVLLRFKNDRCIVEKKEIEKKLITEKSKQDYIKPKTKEDKDKEVNVIRLNLLNNLKKAGIIDDSDVNNIYLNRQNNQQVIENTLIQCAQFVVRNNADNRRINNVFNNVAIAFGFDKEGQREKFIEIFKQNIYDIRQIKALDELKKLELISENEVSDIYSYYKNKKNNEEYIKNILLKCAKDIVIKNNDNEEYANNVINNIANAFGFNKEQRQKFAKIFKQNIFSERNKRNALNYLLNEKLIDDLEVQGFYENKENNEEYIKNILLKCAKDIVIKNNGNEKYANSVFGAITIAFGFNDNQKQQYGNTFVQNIYNERRLNSLDNLKKAGIIDDSDANNIYSNRQNNQQVIENTLIQCAQFVVRNNADNKRINNVFNNVANAFGFNEEQIQKFAKIFKQNIFSERNKRNALNYLVNEKLIDDLEVQGFYENKENNEEHIKNILLKCAKDIVIKNNDNEKYANSVFGAITIAFGFNDNQKQQYGNTFVQNINNERILNYNQQIIEDNKRRLNSLDNLKKAGIIDDGNANNIYFNRQNNQQIIENTLAQCAQFVVRNNADNNYINNVFNNVAIAFGFNDNQKQQYGNKFFQNINNVKNIQNQQVNMNYNVQPAQQPGQNLNEQYQLYGNLLNDMQQQNNPYQGK